jgi:hypothetical protein
MRNLVIPVVVLCCVVFASLTPSTVIRAQAIGVLVAASAAGTSTSSTQKPPQAVNAIGAATASFQKRLEGYLKVRDELTKTFPEVKETGDPNKITAREKALGTAIANARASAKPGDIMGGDMAPVFAQIIAKDWATRSVADRKAIYDELPAGTRVVINRPYPTTLPLLTVPSNLLVNLPVLPEVLEYRIVDRHLLLRDRDANMVVDVLYNVLPRVEKSTRVEK